MGVRLYWGRRLYQFRWSPSPASSSQERIADWEPRCQFFSTLCCGGMK